MIMFRRKHKLIGEVGGGLRSLRKPLHARALKVPVQWDAPEALDNSAYCTPLEAQGRNPWCAAYAMCQILQAAYWRETGIRVQFDEEKCYAQAKLADGITGAGTSLEAVLQVARTEILNPDQIVPEIHSRIIDDPMDIPFAVHRTGMVLVGLNITEGWTSPTLKGRIGNGARRLGGHAVLCSGYSLTEDTLLGPNWWGRTWGVNGFWSMTSRQFAEQFIYGYAVRIQWPNVDPIMTQTW